MERGKVRRVAQNYRRHKKLIKNSLREWKTKPILWNRPSNMTTYVVFWSCLLVPLVWLIVSSRGDETEYVW